MNQSGIRHTRNTGWFKTKRRDTELNQLYRVMHVNGDTLTKRDEAYEYACYSDTDVFLKHYGKWRYFNEKKGKVEAIRKHEQGYHIVWGRSYLGNPEGYGVINQQGKLLIGYSFQSIVLESDRFICKQPHQTVHFDLKGNLLRVDPH